MKKTVSILLVILTISACKKEVSKNIDQDKIWTSFELQFDENLNRTLAKAEFRFSSENGTLLELSEPSNVRFDGSEMEWLADKAYYQLEFSGLVPSGEFEWTDLDGNLFRNTAEIRDVDYPTNIDPLHYNAAVNLFMWEGLPLDSFESVILEIDGTGNTDTKRFSVDSVGSTTITIDSLSLSLVQTDSVSGNLVNLKLMKKYSPPLQQGTGQGGERVGFYIPTNRQITLTD
ncbi:MAG: hypothetical protein EP314_02320 [Bacteroidetes bacterium]|nr:MAG: hypothetical protein EP314_02320 [Bacteroidota bacterium]